MAGAGQAAAQVPPPTAPPVIQTDVKPYDPQLLRLAEVLGALTYLRDLCADKDSETWRARMQSLLDSEGTSQIRKDRLAGAYNKGIEGYALSYGSCTPNARLIIARFLAESGRIAKAIENQFGAS